MANKNQGEDWDLWGSLTINVHGHSDTFLDTFTSVTSSPYGLKIGVVYRGFVLECSSDNTPFLE